MQNNKRIKFLLLTALFTICSQLHAADICVTNSTEFQAALDTAENNGQDDHIKMKKGNYPVPSGNPFIYSSSPSEFGDLKISGGWLTFLGNSCGIKPLNTSAFITELDGESQNDILRIYLNNGVDVTISELNFVAGKNTDGNASGLIIATSGSLNGKTIVENNVFLGNEAKFSSALLVDGGTKTIVRNNLFIANHSEMFGAISLLNSDNKGIYFTNNTVIANTTDGLSTVDSASVYIVSFGTSKVFIANNILWNNDIGDLYFNDGTFLYNNIIGSYTGSTPIDQSNNFSVQPEFESVGPGGLSFIPAYNSNLHNKGIQPPTFVPIPIPFELDWDVGANDTFGKDRVVNGRVDIGSFEAPSEPPIFEDGFEG